MEAHEEFLNLFEFFRDVALRYLRECHGIDGIDAELDAALIRELRFLQAAYRGGDPVAYDTWQRRLAYLLHYAPKHAIIWRIYMRRQGQREEGDVRLSSIGTGPGSEIVGWLEGVEWHEPGALSVACLEPEEGWRDILEIVFAEYEERTGMEIRYVFTNDQRNLEPQDRIIGSFVLTDLGRRGLLTGFRQVMARDLANAQGMFLDTPAFTDATGTRRLVTGCIACTFSHLPTRGFLCMDEINAEMDRCHPIFCRYRVASEPSLNVFTMRFG